MTFDPSLLWPSLASPWCLGPPGWRPVGPPVLTLSRNMSNPFLSHTRLVPLNFVDHQSYEVYTALQDGSRLFKSIQKAPPGDFPGELDSSSSLRPIRIGPRQVRSSHPLWVSAWMWRFRGLNSFELLSHRKVFSRPYGDGCGISAIWYSAKAELVPPAARSMTLGTDQSGHGHLRRRRLVLRSAEKGWSGLWVTLRSGVFQAYTR